MKSIKDLGALVKRKYPGKYDDLADEKIGVLIKKKYPDSYLDFFDDDTFNKVTDLMKFYDPNKGRLSSWWQRGKSESRARLLTVLNEEQRLVIEQGAILQDAVLEGKRKMVDFEMFLANHQFALFQMKANAQLIEDALAQGYTSENWQQVKLNREAGDLSNKNLTHNVSETIRYEGAQTDNQIKLQDNQYGWELKLGKELPSETDNEIKLAAALSQIRMQEAREGEAAKLNNEIAKMQEEVRLAMIADSLNGYQKRVLIQELLDQVYKQIEEIRFSEMLDSTKLRMIQDREEIIIFFKTKATKLIDD